MGRRRSPYQGDSRTRQAKASGFPARSVFKLEEIQKKHRLLKAGQSVLDLGAAPGSWSKYAGQRVGPQGHVLAVDLQIIDEPLGANVTCLRGDALDAESLELGEHAPYDVVLSDMAPRTTGSKSSDRYLSYELCMAALEVATKLGKPGSSFVGKIFMGEDFQAARGEVARRYQSCKVVRPSSTRSVSTEVFLVGISLVADA